jgi:hypothetical protein
MEKQVIEVGQLHEVEFLPAGSPNKQPIGRIEGKVCFVHRSNLEPVKVGETWHVSITEIHPRFFIVMPVYISLTAKETEVSKQIMLEMFRKEKPKKEKTKKQYAFKSFQELKSTIVDS